MRDVTVACVSMGICKGNKEANLARIAQWTDRAADEGAGFVLFPELAVTGFCNEAWKIAEPVPEGPSVQTLHQIARRRGVILCAGIAELCNGITYNTQVIVGPDGFIGKYRKTHIPHTEFADYRPGSRFPVFELGFCRAGMSICYDNAMPECARILALKGAELLIAPYNTSADIRLALEHLLPRCRENALYAIACNKARDIDGPDMSGFALAVGPRGEVIAQTEHVHGEDAMIVARLHGDELRAARADRFCTLRLRRPEIYGELTAVGE